MPATTAPAEPPPIERTPWLRLVNDDQALGNDCRIRWEGVPLHDAARRLREACGVILWIDRRLDPTTRVASDQPRSAIAPTLDGIAKSIDAQRATIAGLHCLAPDARGLPTRLANRLEAIERLPNRGRRVFLASDAVEWPRLTEPQALIAAIIKGRGLSLASPELIPHDRWAAQRLPAAPLADQLTLLLAGFELDWRIEDAGRRVRLTSVEAPRPVAARHRVPVDRREALDRFRHRLSPDTKLLVTSGSATLIGSVQQHAALRRVLTDPSESNTAPPSRDGADRRRQRYTLRVADQPAASLLRSLAEQVGFEVRLLDGAEQALRDAGRVGFETQEATFEELLNRFAEAAGVDVTVRGNTVTIAASPKTAAGPAAD